MLFFSRKKSKPANAVHMQAPAEQVGIADSESETAAVIATAIQMYIDQVREYENTVITMQKIMKPYSPWSSKIYGLRQQPLHMPGVHFSRN